MIKKILLPLLIIFSSIAFAQKPELTGIVIDVDTREPLIGVNVIVDDTSGTTTDVNGTYRYQTTTGAHRLEFRLIGYSSYKTSITLKEAQAQIINGALKNSAKELGTVVVSASKFEQNLSEVVVSMEVLKPTLIENTNQVAADEAMDHVPGVTVIDGQANIRGGSGFSYGAGSRVLVLVDDLPLLAADANDVKWSFLPLENLEQVEVIKGASSALFGSSAMNGIINFRTAYPKSKPETKVILFSGMYDNPSDIRMKWWSDGRTLMASGMNFNHSQKFGQLDLVVGGHFFKDDGFRALETEQRGRLNTNLRYRFKKIDGLSVGVNVNAQQAKGGLILIWQNDTTGALIPSGGIDTSSTISDYTTVRANIDPYITYFTKNGCSHKLRYRYFLSNNKNNTNQESKAAWSYADYQIQKKVFKKITLTGGLVYNLSNVKSELYGDHKSDNMAAYGQSDGKFGRLNTSLGVRIERNTMDGRKGDVVPVFRMGVNCALWKGANIRSSVGQGYRFPSIAEEYVRTQVGSVVIYPNDSLIPETGWSFEIGIQQGFKIKNFKGYIDVALFQQQYQDMMEFTFGSYGQLSDPLYGYGFKSLNIGNTQITGIDLSLYSGGNIGLSRLSLMAGYTFIDPIYTDFKESDTLLATADYNILKYRYQHSFKGDVEYGYSKINIGLSTRYYSFMENIDRAFNVLIPGVADWRNNHHHGDWIFDSRLRYDADDNISVSFIIKNLFNHEWTGRPADMQPQRQYILQVMIDIK